MGIVLLSGHHGRDLSDGDIEDHVWRPLTMTGLNQEVHKTERGAYQFQRIGFGGFLQEFDDIPILHPR